MESFLVFVVISLIFSTLWVMARDIGRMRREVGREVDSDHHVEPSDPRLWPFGHGGGDFGGEFGGDFSGDFDGF